MHDIATIRSQPEAFDAGLARRGAEPVSARILDLDSRRRAVLTQLQEAQNRRNAASKAIGQAMGKGDTEEADRLKAEVSDLKATTLPQLEEQARVIGAELDDLLAGIPNIPAEDVPDHLDALRMHLFEHLADCFVAEGVDTCFALLGDANMNWATALAGRGVAMTYVRHEHCAVAAATAVARRIADAAG